MDHNSDKVKTIPTKANYKINCEKARFVFRIFPNRQTFFVFHGRYDENFITSSSFIISLSIDSCTSDMVMK